jgi:amino acid transporter
LTEVHESIDISQRDDIDKLKSNAVGLGGVLFACLAGAAPITAMLGNVPFAVGFGNGYGTPAGFIFATIVLTIFSVGYVAMCRKITAVGGFYAFISHGLGRVAGVASGLIGAIAYMSIEAALLGGVAFFAQDTLIQRLDITVPWPILAVLAVVFVAVLNYFDVDLSLKVLGVLLGLEVAILLVMDFGVLFQTGKEWTSSIGEVSAKLDTRSLNVAKAFGEDGVPDAAKLGPAIGIFMAFWSWVGFEAAPNYAEESRDPVRNVPRATYISVLALGVFYTFTSWMVVTAWGDKAGEAGGLFGGMFYEATTEFAGSFFTKLMGWLIITGSLACAAAFHNAATRYWYAMGREGLLPRALGRTHPTHKSAHIASAMQSVLSLIVIAIFMVGGTIERTAEMTDREAAVAYASNAAYVGAYTQLALLATLLILILQTAVSIAIIVYFQKNKADAHPWKTLGAPAIATVMQSYVIFLLLSNLSKLGGSKGFVPLIPWTAIAIIALGVGTAMYIKTARPKVYENLGRFVNSGQSS